MNSSFEDGMQFAWDATSLTLAQTCPRKYQLRMLEGLSARETSVHLLFGGLYASALEHFYKYRAQGLDEDAALFRVVKETMIATWDEQAEAPIVFADPQKTRANLIRTIIWYVAQFGDRDNMQTYMLQNGKPAVELSFSLPLQEKFLWCGHLDRVVNYSGALFIQDQKTTKSTIGTHFFEGFQLDNQMSGYIMAGRIILHSPIRGVIIDAAQIAVGSSRFVRGTTSRTEDQLEEWIQNALVVIHDIQRYTKQGYFPMNLTACDHYSRADGTGGCEFKAICRTTPGTRPNVIKSDYTKREWDPLKRR